MKASRHRDVVAAMLAVWGGVATLAVPALATGPAASPTVAVMAGLGALLGGAAARLTIERLTAPAAALAGALAGVLLTAIVARRDSFDGLTAASAVMLAATAGAGAALAGRYRMATPPRTILAGLIAVATGGAALGLAELTLTHHASSDVRISVLLIVPLLAGAAPRLLVRDLAIRHVLGGVWLMMLVGCVLAGLFVGSVTIGLAVGLVVSTGATYFCSIGAVLAAAPWRAEPPPPPRAELPAARTLHG